MSLISARPERLRLADGRARLVGRRRKAIRGSRRAAPPGPTSRPSDREDRRGGKDLGDVGARARLGGERCTAGHVLRHQAHGRHAPAQHRLAGRRRTPRGRARRSGRGRSTAGGVDRPARPRDGSFAQRLAASPVRRRRSARPRRRGARWERGGAPVPSMSVAPRKDDRGGEQKRPLTNEAEGATSRRARALSRAPLPRSRPGRCR